jgi:hypothetical protein
MWTRRSPEEIAEIKRRKLRPKFDPITLVVVWLAVVVASVIGRPGRMLASLWSPTGGSFVSYLVIFGLLTLLPVLIVLFSDRRERDKICPVCRKVQRTESKICSCGGRLEDLEYWKSDENVTT